MSCVLCGCVTRYSVPATTIMSVIRMLQTVAWVAAAIYATIPSFWLVIHPRAQNWRARPRSPYRVLVPMWVGMWIVAGAITWPWRHVVLYSAPAAWIPASALFTAGFALYKTG